MDPDPKTEVFLKAFICNWGYLIFAEIKELLMFQEH